MAGGALAPPFDIVPLPKPTAFVAEHPEDHGIATGSERLAHHAFLSKSEVAEECPDGLIHVLDRSSYAFTPNLVKGIGKHGSHD
jgi:hypothetical protein